MTLLSQAVQRVSDNYGLATLVELTAGKDMDKVLSGTAGIDDFWNLCEYLDILQVLTLDEARPLLRRLDMGSVVGYSSNSNGEDRGSEYYGDIVS